GGCASGQDRDPERESDPDRRRLEGRRPDRHRQLPRHLEGPGERLDGEDRPGGRQGCGDEARMRIPVALQEAVPIAGGALKANKMRGTLTTLGIIIGIVAVCLTMTTANGLQNKFRESFSAVGTDIIYVSRMPWVVMNDFFKYRNRPGIALREAHALE